MTQDQKVKIDGLDDPYNQRRSQDGHLKLQLNDDERKLLQKRDLVAKILILFIEQNKNIPQVVEELGLDPGLMKELIASREWPMLRQAVAERAAEMYLDIRQGWSVASIAEAVGMTPRAFKVFIRSQEFSDAYNNVFHKVTDDPLPRAIQTKIMEELAPAAYISLKEELTGSAVPWTVKQNARRDVFKLIGVEAVPRRDSDRDEAIQYLVKQMGENQINMVNNTININIPVEYQNALRNYLIDPDTIDGSFSDPDEQESSPSVQIEGTDT